MRKYKLNSEGVRAYEEMSGFKTTGTVTLYLPDEEAWDAILNLITPNEEIED